MKLSSVCVFAAALLLGLKADAWPDVFGLRDTRDRPRPREHQENQQHEWNLSAVYQTKVAQRLVKSKDTEHVSRLFLCRTSPP